MRIQFFGAARTVTGSKHLLTTEKGTKILLDCGMFQGIHTDDFNRNFGFNPSEIDYVLLSHAHIDHSGLLPRLVKQGFSGPIYCTPATLDLCKIMLLDSAHIQERDLDRVNRRRRNQSRTQLEPLYDTDDVEKTVQQMKAVPYRSVFFIGEERIEVSFTDTGHILGSAAIHLTLPDEGTFKRLTFTGDIGRPNDKILRNPEPFDQADYIICEATYGDRLHENQADTNKHLLYVVQKTCVERKGKLIIPAFAVDRTQELIYALDQLSSAGLLPRIPVYIDSPLAIRATKVMKEHDDCFNPSILNYIEKDGDAFAFPNLHYISEVAESKALNDTDEPCVIISASGMAEAGRIKHHIRNNIENPNNTLLLVGYAGPHTLAGQLRSGNKEVTIFGEVLEVKAQVEVMHSFSGHGDYQEMLDFLSCQKPERVRKVFLVHGEYEAQIGFKYKLHAAGFTHIEIPTPHQSFTV